MGPTLLFDKSAIQSLSRGGEYEASRYFHTVIPPVLLVEILADLSLDPSDLDGASAKVASLATKILPIDSVNVPHYRTLCIGNLSGHHVPMDRRPVVCGAKTVVTKDGEKGMLIDIMPENEAILRWRSGDFSAEDLKFATAWRAQASGTDFQGMIRQLPKPPVKMQTMEQVQAFVNLMLMDQETRGPVLLWFLGLLRCDQATGSQVFSRWMRGGGPPLPQFAPYAAHCLRVKMLFYIGMSHGLLSTRSSNVVDLEYLCYTPFASIFASGDKLHRRLAPFVMQSDQSFVDRDEIQKAFAAAVVHRAADAAWEPGEDSLIGQLWLKYLKREPKAEQRRPLSVEENKAVMERLAPIIEALEDQGRIQEPLRRFPA